MRGTAGGTLALPFEEVASSLSPNNQSPITYNSFVIRVYSRPFAVRKLFKRFGAAGPHRPTGLGGAPQDAWHSGRDAGAPL